MVDPKKVDMYLSQVSKKFPEGKMLMMKDALSQLEEDQFLAVQSLELKDPNTVMLISVFFGELGVDRFMVGDTLLGVLKLITCGASGAWWLIDLFLIQDRTKEYNFGKLKDLLMANGITIY